MSYRIVFGGIHIESTTFTSYISSKSDFIVTAGDELLKRYPWLNEFSDIECIPLTHARALPGGVVSGEFYHTWKKRFLDMLQRTISEKPIDGVLFDVHGAMSVEDMIDAEGFLAEEIRNIVGDKVIISASMDLHGNVSDKLFESCDLLTCYRTAPHIDTIETRKRAFINMIDLLDKDRTDKIFKARVDIPILLPGEKTSTEVEPGKSLYKSLDKLCDHSDIIDASIWMGYPWADEERCHASIVVIGTNERKIKEEAKNLSIKMWNLKEQFKFVGPVAETNKAIDIALNSVKKPFFISDTGDNPGAGGSGDLNIILSKFIIRNNDKIIKKKTLFASIFDREAINRIYSSNPKENISLQLGGHIDKEYGKPLDIVVSVYNLFEDQITGRGAVVRIENLYIIITENRFQYGSLKDYKTTGVKGFNEFDVIVVKMGYLEPDLSEAATGWVMALSKGAVNQDLVNIDFRFRLKPLFPFEDFEYKPNIKTQ